MTRKVKIFGASIFALLMAALIVIPIVSCTPQGNAYDKYYDLEFHSGGKGAMPENTMYAFTYAIEQGATTIETQLQMTKDGVVVASHSPLLNPEFVMDKNGNYVTGNEDIRTMNFSEVEQYNVGHAKKGTEYYSQFGTTQYEVDAKIPTLEELFKLVQDSGNKEIMLNIETKLYPDPALGALYQNNVDKEVFVKKILDLAKQYNMERRIVIQSFDWSVFPIIQKINPNILTAALWEEIGGPQLGVGNLWLEKKEASPWLAGYNIHDVDENAVDIAYALGCNIVSPQLDEITTMQIIQCHDWGMRVIPWYVDSLKDMEKAWEMECDGFITNYGYLGREFLYLHEASIPEPYEFNSPYHIDLL